MGNQGLKYAAAAAVGLAIVLGVLAYRMTVTATKAARDEARAELAATDATQAQATTLAVIALKPLSATRAITTDDIALMPVAVVPQRYFTNVDDVIGKIPLIDIDVGAPVTPRYFRDSNVLARLIPEEHQAMSLEISDVVAVGGFVRPGDEVDVLMFLREGDSPAQSRMLLEKALILAYEDRIIDRPEGLTKEEGRPERRSRVRTAVIAVPEKETTRVMLGASLGELRLALHRQEITTESDSESESFMDGEGSPIPLAEMAIEEKTELPPAEKDKVVTLAELTRIAAKKPKRRRPAPYYIQVYRGSESEKVRD